MCGSRTGGWSLPGCALTGVGAGEEQARKVVVGEASRCGEDKWPTESSAVRMVARTAGRSRGRFLG
jgi:hypothetical protein